MRVFGGWRTGAGVRLWMGVVILGVMAWGARGAMGQEVGVGAGGGGGDGAGMQDAEDAAATQAEEVTSPGAFDGAGKAPLRPESNGDHDIDKRVMCLAEDRQKRVWVGTEGDGLWLYDPAAAEADKQWRSFGVKEGLGDDNVYALAMDKLGRVWAGHLNHGVSVYNGEKWQNYEVAAGLSREDSRAGPLGERVYAMATSPVDGDMWVATSAGITRYSVEKDTWSYLTRVDGLPSDQISTLAFDKAGMVYVGTECDGIAIGKAANNYKTWTRVKGPDGQPGAATGRGLPSNLINQILVGRDGSIYAATDAGLAKSVDHGASWMFTRGTNWTRMVEMAGKPALKAPPIPKQPAYMLAEDRVMCLAEDEAGQILIGMRSAGYQVLMPADAKDPKASTGATAGTLQGGQAIRVKPKGTTPAPHIRALLPRGNMVLVGLYEGGMQTVNAGGSYVAKAAGGPATTASTAASAPASEPAIPALPSSAAGPTAAELKAMGDRIGVVTAARAVAMFIGDDWRTQGDWVGHYGRQYAVLGAGLGPFDEFVTNGAAYYRVYPLSGASRLPEDGIRRWIHAVTDTHVPYDPALGHRSETEWDDHGEVYPMALDGPDMHFQVTVPAGVSRVSIYFVNQQGRYNAERWRDYVIDVRRVPAELGGRVGATPLRGPLESDPPALPAAPEGLATNAGAPAAWNALPVLARARVKDFFGGVYKQFAVMGPGTFDFGMRRNFSYNTICSAVFIDRLSGPATSLDGSVPLLLEGPAYEPPAAPKLNADTASAEALAAAELWGRLDGAQGNPAVASLEYEARVLAYRAGAGASAELAENWRWKLRLWSAEDRSRFEKGMADIWQYQMVHYPELHKGVMVDVKPKKP